MKNKIYFAFSCSQPMLLNCFKNDRDTSPNTAQLFIFLMFCLTVTASCSSNPPKTKWDESTVSKLNKGMAQKEITTLIGEPDNRQETLSGKSTWTYKKKPQGGSGFNTVANIASFGIASAAGMQDYEYLILTFDENDLLVDATFQPVGFFEAIKK